MGRKSTKENKNVYQTSRESLGLTREAAAEKLEFLSADRIEKIESEKSLPHPDEILAMADCYKNPSLCNYYCSHECPIGQECVPEVQIKDLSQITLEMLASLNTLNRDKDRLIEITVDGQISADELDDFHKIQAQLGQISQAIDSLQLWVQKAIMDGTMSEDQVLYSLFTNRSYPFTYEFNAENKTIRFPVDMLARIDTVMRENDVSFTGFVLQACKYVLDELENDSSTKNGH